MKPSAPKPSARTVVFALAGLGLSACTARDPARTSALGPSQIGLDATLHARGPGGATQPPAQVATPVMVLPAWIGRPLRLRERDEADAFEQAVSLSLAPRGTTRENLVLLRRSRLPSAASGQVMDGVALGGRPTEAGIRAELAAVFPGTPMQVVTRPARNAYGPYGLAIGRAPSGARCLYAWQWIAEAPALDPADGPPGPLSLRVRICRDDINLEAMAAAVNQLKLVPRYAGTPVADTRPSRAGSAAPRLRSHGGAHVAVARSRRQARLEPADDAPVRAAAIEPSPARTARAEISPAAAPPLPPLPPGRRYLGVTEPSAIQGEVARDTSNTSGLAVARGVAIGAAPAPQAASLSPDLPPEALRGPPARPSGRP